MKLYLLIEKSMTTYDYVMTGSALIDLAQGIADDDTANDIQSMKMNGVYERTLAYCIEYMKASNYIVEECDDVVRLEDYKSITDELKRD